MTLHALAIFANTKLIPSIMAIIGFSLLIVIHEFGHFIFCKIFGVHTPTFSVGFGPKLIEKKIGSTNFRIAKIPFGGYVEIAGLAEPGQGDQEFAHAQGDISFDTKPYWQKFLILMGGILFNLASAYITFSVIFMVGHHAKDTAITISHVVEQSAAEKYGVKTGDKIVKVNNIDVNIEKDIRSFQEAIELLSTELKKNPLQEVVLSVMRHEELNDKASEKLISLNIILDSKELDGKAIGSLGTHFAPPSINIEKQPPLQAIKMGIQETNKCVIAIVSGLVGMFKRKSLEGAGGPVLIIAQTFKSAQGGIIPLLIFLALMSINLAIFNLLPLGILDGGNLMFVTIEAIIRRPLPESFRIGVNLISIVAFIGLALYLTYQDIVRIFGNIFVLAYDKIMGLFS